MKAVILLSAGLAFCSLSFCQEKLYGVFPVKDDRIIYEKVVTVDSASKIQLYNRAKTWGLGFYNSQKDVLQLDDKETGVIAYKGFFSVPFTPPPIFGTKSESYNWNYWETVKILLKDGKAKIVVEDLTIKTQSGASVSIAGYEETIDNFKGASRRYKDEYKEATYKNFVVADEKLMAIISSAVSALKTGAKSEFDF